jgi:sugar phosphate isomerase/epimerase
VPVLRALQTAIIEMMTRRELLAGALAAVPLEAKTRRVDRSRISAITDEIARSPAGAIAFIKQYGLGLVELREVPGGGGAYEALPEADLRAAAREFASNRIRVSYFDAGLFKFSMPGTEPVRRTPESETARQKRLARDGERFERRMEHLERAIRAAKILGSDKVRIFAFSRVEDPIKLMPRIASVFEPMVKMAEKAKVRLLVENEASCNIATCAELAALMKLMPSKWIGINWDTLNGGSREKAFPDGYNLLPKNRIGNVHIKGRSVLDGPQKQDWATIFATMVKDGYRGSFGLETHIFGETQVQSSHASMKEILRILESA